MQIDRLRQVTEKELDIFAICRSLTLGDFQICAKDAALSGIIIAFLGPVELSAFNVESYAHAPIFRIRPVGFAMARLYERLDMRTIQVRTHDSHAFAIRPIKLAILLIELELLGSNLAAPRTNIRAILPFHIRSFH